MTSAPQDGQTRDEIACGSDAEWPASNVLPFPLAHDVGEVRDVERLDQYAFYDLAKDLQKLVFPDGDDVVAKEALLPLFHARVAVRALEDGKPFQLGLSRTPCRQLLAHIDGIMRDHFEEVVDGQRRMKFPDNQDAPIPDWKWSNLMGALNRFETVFREELREAATYYVPRRGIYFTPALVDAADETFPTDVKAHIPHKTLVEWQSAGRCLAFNLLSASGFHVARAVEGTMETYYQLFSGKAGKTLRSWHDYAKELEKLVKPDKPDKLPSDKIVAEIKQMKDDYRNPLMHPRVVLTESDARMLFNNGESLIIGMAQEIRDAQKGQNALLALVPPATPQEGKDSA